MRVPYTILFILVEGNDDVRFFDTIVKPLLETKYDSVLVRPYRHQRPRKVGNFLRSIKAMNRCYLLVADINGSPCITAKKQQIQNRYRDADASRIVVVRREIESWYLAGLDDASCRELGVTPVRDAHSITKQQFDSVMPSKFNSRIDFMWEILKCFDADIARQKNRSFEYFVGKHDC